MSHSRWGLKSLFYALTLCIRTIKALNLFDISWKNNIYIYININAWKPKIDKYLMLLNNIQTKWRKKFEKNK